jgi:hypothetical protein
LTVTTSADFAERAADDRRSATDTFVVVIVFVDLMTCTFEIAVAAGLGGGASLSAERRPFFDPPFADVMDLTFADLAFADFKALDFSADDLDPEFLVFKAFSLPWNGPLTARSGWRNVPLEAHDAVSHSAVQ